jgi:hypothetical protein
LKYPLSIIGVGALLMAFDHKLFKRLGRELVAIGAVRTVDVMVD